MDGGDRGWYIRSSAAITQLRLTPCGTRSNWAAFETLPLHGLKLEDPFKGLALALQFRQLRAQGQLFGVRHHDRSAAVRYR